MIENRHILSSYCLNTEIWGCLQNQEPNGMEWNGMKFTFQENKKPGMERNGMEWNGKEWKRMERNGMKLKIINF